ncbi:hypothetical protein AYJ57_21820 (plasmid) [Salipiger sp. CCB-MM3]|uniref:hypothetical protein n=1 Tax=Salipiger sp. CCB-MM3 TaxID=1792508 RepID=UPI00080AB738|nr:hypothetical protein [Salipiger sp. CCB-MM3]ANT63110.1 hypothetical protein AYJ57_21820 [Salipiger sp. CCB-MM3]
MSVLLSEDFDELMEAAMVSPYGEIDGHAEEYEFLWEAERTEADVINTRPDGYSICAMNDADHPAVVLVDPDGKVSGFYYRFAAWIDEEHRGHGLSVETILAYDGYFQDAAWEGDLQECIGGMTFSDGGYRAHTRAQQVALKRASEANNQDPELAPGMAL